MYMPSEAYLFSLGLFSFLHRTLLREKTCKNSQLATAAIARISSSYEPLSPKVPEGGKFHKTHTVSLNNTQTDQRASHRVGWQ